MDQEIADKIAREYTEITQIQCSSRFMQFGDNHVPSTLRGEQGVYVFLRENQCFKVGKAGPKSGARWNSNHYYFHSTQPSVLARTLINKREEIKNSFPLEQHDIFDDLNEQNTKDWMRRNLSRIEFKISSDETIYALNLLESFVQFKLKPLYEGREKS